MGLPSGAPGLTRPGRWSTMASMRPRLPLLIAWALAALSLGCGSGCSREDAQPEAAPMATTVAPAPAAPAEQDDRSLRAPESGEGATTAPQQPAPPTPAAPPPFDIDAWMDSLPAGAIAFNAPDQVELGQVVRLRLLVQPGASPDALGAAHAEGASPRESGPLQTASAAVSPEIEARLASADLDVTALDPERQSVSARSPTEWRWDVRARQGGDAELTLGLFAIPPDGASVRRIQTFERAMRVHVPWTTLAAGFLGDNWEWLWTLLVAPVGGWFWAKRGRRTERAD